MGDSSDVDPVLAICAKKKRQDAEQEEESLQNQDLSFVDPNAAYEEQVKQRYKQIVKKQSDFQHQVQEANSVGLEMIKMLARRRRDKFTASLMVWRFNMYLEKIEEQLRQDGRVTEMYAASREHI